MSRALDLAIGGQGRVEPNPMVGCVLVRDQQIIGEGFHREFGGPHAEIDALSRCDDATGSTAYVTLEPCCHEGKTPPCSRALVDAGVRRVVIARGDPFPKVAGGGIDELRRAGLQVDIGLMRPESDRLLAPYLKRVSTGLPWVIGKWAMTADGRIATTTGQSQWITSEDARRDVHQTRGRVDAIVVGMGTVRQDDPMLTARPPGPRTARRVVLCRRTLPEPTRRLVRTAADVPTLVFAPSDLDPGGQSQLVDAGVQIVDPVSIDDDLQPPGQEIRTALRWLGQASATNVLLECGATLMAAFSMLDLIDEFHVYVGAKLFGGDTAPGPLGGEGRPLVSDASLLILSDVQRFGDDVKLVYHRSSSSVVEKAKLLRSLRAE